MKLTQPLFDNAELDNLRACLESGWVTQGPFTEQFEAEVGRRQGAKHAFACTSCTTGLHLAVAALGIGAGDEVVVPALTWVTSAFAAEYVGATVVFADIDPVTYNLEPAQLRRVITPKTKAVIAVHLFGLSAPMNDILDICRPRGIAVIEDAACAIGTSYQGRPVGAIGDIGCFSFHPRKIITTGEGGVVTTNRDDIATAIRALRNHGATGLPDPNIEAHGPWTMATFKRLGFNFRLSDIQSAVGLAQMGKLDSLLDERRALAMQYSRLLEGATNELMLPTAAPDIRGHTFQSYVIGLRSGGRVRRNHIMSDLAAQDIQTRPGTHAVPRLDFYRQHRGVDPSSFPNAATAEDTSITLPMFPGMTEADQSKVVSVIRAALAAHRG